MNIPQKQKIITLFVFEKIKIMSLKPGPKRTAISTGKPDRRQRDNKETPGNTPSLLPPKNPKKK
jgi:hypothetical protein